MRQVTIDANYIYRELLKRIVRCSRPARAPSTTPRRSKSWRSRWRLTQSAQKGGGARRAGCLGTGFAQAEQPPGALDESPEPGRARLGTRRMARGQGYAFYSSCRRGRLCLALLPGTAGRALGQYRLHAELILTLRHRTTTFRLRSRPGFSPAAEACCHARLAPRTAGKRSCAAESPPCRSARRLRALAWRIDDPLALFNSGANAVPKPPQRQCPPNRSRSPPSRHQSGNHARLHLSSSRATIFRSS